MSIEACATLVEKGDPDRFLAAMSAPPEARQVLFPLYAFNLEVARAPWVTSEPMIAEMRLQWWRDALGEIETGSQIRRHEVVTPLSKVPGLDIKRLTRLIDARRWDIYDDPFEDFEHFKDYIAQTAGGLMATAATALGAPEPLRDDIQKVGQASGFARFLSAVERLQTKGKSPLAGLSPNDLSAFKSSTFAVAGRIKTLRRSLPKSARPVLNDAWQTRALLQKAIKDPASVAEGRLALSPFRKRLALLLST
jgi:phytoene/squalene synthetase